MDSYPDNTLCKDERLSGKTALDRLLKNGRFGTEGCMKFCAAPGNGTWCNRILISVPKRNFKRAVKRNLLKRRIREAYRTQKNLLPPQGYDIMFQYLPKEVLDSSAIREGVAAVLTRIAKSQQK